MACDDTEIQKHLTCLRDKLEECIEPLYGFLPKLLSSEVLSDREFGEIDSEGPDSYKQCFKLLNIMQRKTSDECTTFIAALKETEQKHVANYISQKARRFNSDHVEFFWWPLEPIHRMSIIINLNKLVQCEDCAPELSNHLWSNFCINDNQKEVISNAPTSYKRNETLLRMLLRRSIRDYNVFLEYIQKNLSQWASLFDQDTLKTKFEDHAAEKFDCTVACSSAKPVRVRQLENRIVRGFRTATQKIRKWINSVIHRDCNPYVKLVDMQDGHSIRCFVFCGTPDALQSLYISINNGSLMTTMQWIFQQLLGCEESVFVVKITGRLNLSRQKERVEEFCTDIGHVNTSTLLYDLSESGFKKPFWFPYEVLEPILMQVAVKLFKVNQVRLLLPRPDVTAIVTISSVCQDWFEVITGRRILRRKLKSTFRKSTVIPTELFKAAVLLRHRLSKQPMTSRDADVNVLKTMASVCCRWCDAVGESGDLKRVKRLFHYNPQLLVTLSEPPTYSDGRPRRVQGVVMLDNFVYIVYESYNKVEVFNCKDCYKKVKEIEVEEMEEPRDMVGSSETSQLFIFDSIDVIRRLDFRTGVSDVFITIADVGCAWLSLAENRLLVPSLSSLLLYDIHSGERIKKIPLTEDLQRYAVRQAIESNRDSFFVNHRPWCSNNSVSEIDSAGRVNRVFNTDEQLYCLYLALDSVGRLLVADFNNSRVLLLDGHLKFKRILIDNKRLDNSSPWRLNYNKNNNRLAVGLVNGQVEIFECNEY